MSELLVVVAVCYQIHRIALICLCAGFDLPIYCVPNQVFRLFYRRAYQKSPFFTRWSAGGLLEGESIEDFMLCYRKIIIDMDTKGRMMQRAGSADYVIGVDMGTQGVRGLAVDSNGTV